MNSAFNLRGFNAIFYKETRQLVRSPATFVFTVCIPMLQLLLLGYAINTTVEHVPAAVYERRPRPGRASLPRRDRRIAHVRHRHVRSEPRGAERSDRCRARARRLRHPREFHGRRARRPASRDRRAGGRLGFGDRAGRLRVGRRFRRHPSAGGDGASAAGFRSASARALQPLDAQRGLLRAGLDRVSSCKTSRFS